MCSYSDLIEAMKIVSWNIQQGGGRRAPAIVQYLTTARAHILVLSEFRNNATGVMIRKRLLDHGFSHQAASDLTKDKNGVLIASKYAFELDRPRQELEYAYGVLQCRFAAFHLIGAYLPHKKKHRLFEILLASAAQNQPLIIAGDLNTGHNFVDQKGDSFWYTKELDQLESSAMIDAFRHCHGQAKEYSWYSHGGNGFRYDHTYVKAEMLPVVKECFYDHQVRENKLSDHSAMVLKLG